MPLVERKLRMSALINVLDFFDEFQFCPGELVSGGAPGKRERWIRLPPVAPGFRR
jgi:hypothetical protein